MSTLLTDLKSFLCIISCNFLLTVLMMLGLVSVIIVFILGSVSAQCEEGWVDGGLGLGCLYFRNVTMTWPQAARYCYERCRLPSQVYLKIAEEDNRKVFVP